MATVRVSRERKRGCGFRKGGGIYLVSRGLARVCGRLPIPCGTCPTCGNGIKAARGWTWVDGDALVGPVECREDFRVCSGCILAGSIGRAGLLWIGESFYPRPVDWIREAVDMGVSRRISAVPKGLVPGETIVLVAHRKAIVSANGDRPVESPGIFHAFIPSAVEYVVKGDESERKLASLETRGIELVKVVPVQDQEELFSGESDV